MKITTLTYNYETSNDLRVKEGPNDGETNYAMISACYQKITNHISKQKPSHFENIVLSEVFIIWIDGKIFTIREDFNRLAFSMIEFQESYTDEEYIVPIIIIGDLESINRDLKNPFSSTIYQRYLDYSNKEFLTVFMEYIFRFQGYFNQKLYYSNIVKEHFDITWRLISINYLKDYGGGHGKMIDPFIFHSEEHFYDQAFERLQELRTQLTAMDIDDLVKWKILLIDDFSDQRLNVKFRDNNGSTDTRIGEPVIRDSRNKYDLLINLINSFGHKGIGNGESEGPLKKYISEVTYCNHYLEYDLTDNNCRGVDIILLDYLFSPSDRFKTTMYGTQFISKVNTGETSLNQSVGDRSWIIPTSVFNQSMIDEIRHLGIHLNTNKFTISRGADFINTPYLFMYNLITVMQSQLDLLAQSASKKLFPDEVTSLIEFPQSNLSTRIFDDVNREFEKYKKWYKNKESSLLTKSYFEAKFGVVDISDSVNQKIEEFYEHLKILSFNLQYRNFETNEEIYIEHELCRQIYESISLENT